MKNILLKTTLFSIIVFSMLAVSCDRDFLETVPTRDVSDVTATSTADNLMLVVNGMHRSMYVRQGGQGYSGISGLMVILDSFGEDMVHTAVGLNWHMTAVRWLSQANDTDYINEYPYNFGYRMIRNANIIIAYGDQATGDQATKERAIGEAYAYRAYFYHLLVQLYGKRYLASGNNTQLGIPLVLEPNLEKLPRSTVEEVYAQINKDLDKSLSLLTGKTRSHKSHFDVNVVYGLKARVAMTQGKWQNAADYAKLARQNYPLMNNIAYQAGFNKIAEGEWIWGSEILPDQTDYFGNFGAYVSRNYNSSTIRLAPKAINVLLYNSFPATDVRTKNFDPTGLHTSLGLPSNFVKKPYTSQKFLAVSVSDSRADVPLMRAAEMYLIEAEALARIPGKEAESKIVFNFLEKNRNPSYAGASNTGQAYIDEILKSRRIELWGEGFRFLDLKRLNLPLDRSGGNHVATVINNLYTVDSKDLRWEFSIPRTEIDANSLIVQNPK